jgi:hypothetical protein
MRVGLVVADPQPRAAFLDTPRHHPPVHQSCRGTAKRARGPLVAERNILWAYGSKVLVPWSQGLGG